MTNRHRAAQRLGAIGEQIAETALRAKGVRQLHKIATPFRVIGTRKIGGQDWYKVVFDEKPPGDREGILPNGRRVLVEVKAREDCLRWSDVKPHQRAALETNARLNGLSLLVWLDTAYNDVFIMEWPLPKDVFAPRKSISRAQASRLEWGGYE